MKPVNAHLFSQDRGNAFAHLAKVVSNRDYLRAFAATTLLATGGFMLMPFASAFSVNNLGIPVDKLPMLYMFTGIFSMASGPLIGKLSDSVGKYTVFLWGTLVSCAVVIIYCNLGVTPLWAVIIVSIIMFMAVSSRMISSSALMTAVPEPADRGAFMGINSSIQQISGGVATFVAGLIVVQTASGKLENYDILGYTVVGSSLLTAAMLYSIHLYVARKSQQNFQKAAA
jgi:predicted MFS family arabinose efflux permease